MNHHYEQRLLLQKQLAKLKALKRESEQLFDKTTLAFKRASENDIRNMKSAYTKADLANFVSSFAVGICKLTRNYANSINATNAELARINKSSMNKIDPIVKSRSVLGLPVGSDSPEWLQIATQLLAGLTPSIWFEKFFFFVEDMKFTKNKVVLRMQTRKVEASDFINKRIKETEKLLLRLKQAEHSQIA